MADQHEDAANLADDEQDEEDATAQELGQRLADRRRGGAGLKRDIKRRAPLPLQAGPSRQAAGDAGSPGSESALLQRLEALAHLSKGAQQGVWARQKAAVAARAAHIGMLGPSTTPGGFTSLLTSGGTTLDAAGEKNETGGGGGLQLLLLALLLSCTLPCQPAATVAQLLLPTTADHLCSCCPLLLIISPAACYG